MAAAQVSGTPAPGADPSGGAPPADAVVESPVVETVADDGVEDDAEAREAAALAELTGKATPKEEKPKPKEEPKEEIPSIEEQSRSFAALKHKTQRFNEERAAFAEEKRAFEETQAKDKAEIEKLRTELEGRRERAKKTPLEALKELGWTPDQLLQYIGENGEIPKDRLFQTLKEEMQKELEEVRNETKKEREAREAAEAENLKKRQAEESSAFQRRVGMEIVDIATQEAEKYKYLNKILRKDPGAIHREVLNRIAHAYKTTKKPLAVSDAMLQIEKQQADWFEDQPDPQQAGAVKPANPGSIEPIPKLDTAKRGVAPKKELDELTEEEREELALRIAKGEVE